MLKQRSTEGLVAQYSPASKLLVGGLAEICFWQLALARGGVLRAGLQN